MLAALTLGPLSHLLVSRRPPICLRAAQAVYLRRKPLAAASFEAVGLRMFLGACTGRWS